MATAGVEAMVLFHRLLSTWRKRVDCYITLSEFARQLFIQGGIPLEKLCVMPNFVYSDPGKKESQRKYALFVGRLSTEKGIDILLRAWSSLGKIPLHLAGEGPRQAAINSMINDLHLQNIVLAGQISRERVFELLKSAKMLVFPSLCYEGFPLVIAEAFACGVPVIASRLGAMAEIIEDGKTGLLFTAGDPVDLAAKVDWAWNHPIELAEMGRIARREYEQKYSAEVHYKSLMAIYSQTIKNHCR